MTTARRFRNDEADWQAVRDLLVEVFPHVPPGWTWDIRRWDGWRFHNAVPEIPPALAADIGVWEDAGGTLVAAVHPEGGGDAYLELRPEHRELEPEMLAWAEEHLTREVEGVRAVETVCWAGDETRARLLAGRGWRPRDDGARIRRARVDDPRTPVPDAEPELAPGYRLATTTERTAPADAAHMADLLNAAFRRSIHSRAEYATFMARSPSFRHDLNLVATAPDGTFAAHVGVTFDEINRHGIFEPVCTHPAHRRRGLAAALMAEGLRRLRALEARTAAVESGLGEEANAFYDTLGFTERVDAESWRFERPARPVPPAGG